MKITTKQENPLSPGDQEDSVFIEQLLSRIAELEDFQQRLEDSAASTIEMAEELAGARDKAEAALRESEKYQREIEALARHDHLTGLANRREFRRAFDAAISAAARHGALVSLLLFDLDEFKIINDTYGHPVGDELLKFFAETLKNATRETDTVARLGGDEFAIVLTGLHAAEKSTIVAQRVIAALSQPLVLDKCMLTSGTSVGISVYPKDGLDPEVLLSNGDKALYVAKSNGRGTYQFFDNSLNEKAKQAHIFESDLRMAIVRNEFVLDFQPQHFAGPAARGCAEALVRWRHPVRGMLAPDKFIGTAEDNGLIIDIGWLILAGACRECRKWHNLGHDSLCVAVNISSVQFAEPGFVEVIEKALADSGLEAKYLELEITESCLMDQRDLVAEKLRQLRSMGVKVSVDDFGTGYSSLAYLKQLPIDKIKIDKLFIDQILSNSDDLAIVDAIIKLGHTLGLEVIAEGVEQKEQAMALYKNGCDAIQGYLISKPMAPDTFLDWLSVQNQTECDHGLSNSV